MDLIHSLTPLGSPEYTSILVPTSCAPTLVANAPIAPDKPSNNYASLCSAILRK